MLTIKHIYDGREFVFEAEYFTSERRKDGNTQYTAFDDHAGEYKQTWCGRAAPMPALHQIYVMNRYGKTIGSYGFSDPDFS